MAIQADKPKDDWYEIVKELKKRKGLKENPTERAPRRSEDDKANVLDTTRDDTGGSKSPGRRISLNALKERVCDAISPKTKN